MIKVRAVSLRDLPYPGAGFKWKEDEELMVTITNSQLEKLKLVIGTAVDIDTGSLRAATRVQDLLEDLRDYI